MAKMYSGPKEDFSAQNLLKRELWDDKLHESKLSAVHGRFMKPSCRAITKGLHEHPPDECFFSILTS
jgi:hypothetical protein